MIQQYIKRAINQVIPKKKEDLHGFEYTVTELINMYEEIQNALEWHGEILSNKILEYKKSDTVFILGSGPSINSISKTEWEHIAQKDSIGFNYWLAHDFIPTMYMFQFTKYDNLLALLRDKHYQYKEIPFIIRGSGLAKGELKNNKEKLNLFKKNPVYYLREYPIHSKCSLDLNLLYKYMDALGYMKYGEITSFIPKWRSTLGLLLMLAYQMGYKKIVLCGMDMYKKDHFWDYYPYNNIKYQYSLPDVGSSNINLFTDHQYSKNTVPKYVYSLRDWFYNKNRVKVFVNNKHTVLYPEIEIYNYYSNSN